MTGKPGSIAYIYSDNELLEVIDLSTVNEPYNVTVTEKGGGMNVIAVERGRIRVSEADCNGSDCVRQGWISGSAAPVVCLPHRLVIRIAGETHIDGAVG